LIAVQTMREHVHVLVEVDPQFRVHRLVRAIKGRSSRVPRDEFRWVTSELPSLWTDAYFVAVAGGGQASVIKRYVAIQTGR
jgi:putative transposase